MCACSRALGWKVSGFTAVCGSDGCMLMAANVSNCDNLLIIPISAAEVLGCGSSGIMVLSELVASDVVAVVVVVAVAAVVVVVIGGTLS